MNLGKILESVGIALQKSAEESGKVMIAALAGATMSIYLQLMGLRLLLQ